MRLKAFATESLSEAAGEPRGGFLRGSGRWLAVLLLAILTPLAAVAQIGGSAAIEGTVVDSSGAIVVGAKVTAKAKKTGAQMVRATDKTGRYSLSPLDVGDYDLSALAPGFETLVRPNIHVDGMQVLALDLILQIGSTATTVTVTDVPPALETENATLGSVMENDVYQSLPLEMGAAATPDQRRATDFAALMPGVSSNMVKNNETSEPMVVNGNAFSSEMYVEGIPVTSVATSGDPRYIWTAFSVETVDQFQLKTSAYSAEYRGLGVENFTIKSAGNQLHGSVYTVARNTAFDAIGFLPGKDASGNWLNKAAPEHMNEHGMSVGGPLWKNKIFLFANYMDFRFSTKTLPQYQNMPTQAMSNGDFSALLSASAPTTPTIFDPTTEVCATTSSCTRTGFAGNIIPKTKLSPIAQNMESFLAPLYADGEIGTSLTNNYVGSYAWGLSNWTTSERLDAELSPKQKVSAIFGWGRQGLIGSSSQVTNEGPEPYRAAKSYHPITKDVMLEHTWLINDHLVNQLKYAALQYFAPTINQTYGTPAYEATTMGIQGLPSYGQTGKSFPDVTFTSTSSPDVNFWGPQSANLAKTDNFTAVDNMELIQGKHSISFGGQYQWLSYNYYPTADGSSILAMTFKNSETAPFSSKTTLGAGGYDYASYMLGAVDSSSYQAYAPIAQETGTRFHPFALFINDDYKLTPKLTINAGLRWDYLPPFHEAENRYSFLNPNGKNPYTGTPGALQFAGYGADSCGCRTPVNAYLKNFGPRLGMAYELNSKTVLRASAGVYYALGGGTGGVAQSTQPDKALMVGYSASPSAVAQTYGLPAFYLNGNSGFTAGTTVQGISNDPTNVNFGGKGYTVVAPPLFNPGYGTIYSTNTVSPDNISTTLGYLDPKYGGRAPEFVGWTVGFQRMLTKDITATVSYVGNQGHFLLPTGTERGINANQLDPKYLAMGANLSLVASAANLTANGLSLPYPTFTASQKFSQMLKPFPQYSGITDEVDSVANSNYNSLQLSINQRMAHGLTLMLNYTFSKNIDNAGTFRAGYAIPAAVSADGKAYAQGKADRSLSTIDQRQNVTGTATYDLPFGMGHIGGENVIVRNVVGGWRLSGIFTYFGGNPLTITQGTCTNNSVGGTCMPALTPGFTGSARQNGGWGHGATRDNLGTMHYINPAAFTLTGVAATPYTYMIGNATRTAPYGLRGPGNYNIDGSLRRSFNVWNKENVKFVFEANVFNAVNHVWFGSTSTNASGSIGQSFTYDGVNASTLGSFGTVVGQANNPRQWQFAGHLNF